ncbi:uncharacterized protein F4807DRAFT_426440 [Annulohypoxylon truncatum]|uniref:uncharacterized protein n=1 Tax=Annulohypoxylon truncatum TaxID=327061 RepID=UPI0020073BBB|nr:uncharacterized protein F4807DRAFT_426440 [Annulohypoxylon truncatum]KAI1209355.1 hypothetical protein F4807DRAFT_426440 [Annulohypoxylon truncatum]
MDRNPPNSPRVPATKANGNINGNGNSNGLGIGRGGRNTTQPFSSRRIPQKSPSKPDSKDNITSDTDTSPNTGSRHPLYSSPKYIPHSHGFSASANKISESPRETRIPQPKTTAAIASSFDRQNSPINNQRNKQRHPQTQSLDMRQPLNLKSAFELARQQEADDTLDDTISIKHAFNMASAEMNGRIDGSPSPAPRRLQSRQSYSAAPQRTLTTGTNNDLGRHLQQFDRNHQLSAGNGPLNGLFGRNRIGPKVSETGNVLAKTTSDNDLRGSPVRRRDSQQNAISRADEHAEAVIPIPSIEHQPANNDRSDRASSTKRPANPSPEKSFNWELDADFTAGDLQISESPRIRTDQSNGRSRRTSSITSTANGTANSRRSNNRIDEIRQKEIEAANAVLPEEDASSFRRSNSRLDEIRVREMDALSKRAVATSRLDEIRVRNSEAREESPETGRTSNREEPRGGSLQLSNEHAKPPENQLGLKAEEEQVVDTPAIVPRSTSEQKPNEPPKERANASKTEYDRNDSQLSRNDSQDLLRRLARATSASPPSEKTEPRVISDTLPPKERSDSRENSRSRSAREERKSRNLEVKNLEVKSSRERPTVGFAGLRSTSSSDSIREKGSSLHGSEMDPLDRIEAELRLFAPLDNYSEKGSVRAPSPVPSEPAEEETPRVSKVDPLTQPTPRVTGAYVETPATVRVKQENHVDEEKVSDAPSRTLDPISKPRNRDSSQPSNNESVKHEDDDITTLRRTSVPRSSSVPTASRRARSVSRRRQPLRPIINTAKPPTVKDDIRAILRMNQIDDSTLEDFDSILANQDIDDEELQQMMDDTIDKIDKDPQLPDLSERDCELQIYDRMSKSLRTGLLGIQSAKKGIERLEDRVMHTELKAEQTHTDQNTSQEKSKIHIPVSSSSSAPVMLTLPALYRRDPKLRPTKFGMLAIAMLIWYTLESIFCVLYVPQYNCTPEIPCDWSPNEPYFPYAMPFMLDEWATGGKGRALTWKVGEEIGDIYAEVSDWVTKRDFTQLDEKFMNVWERKRHRRRLRKRGLVPKWVAPPDYKPRFPQWNAARLAMEATEEGDYDAEDETMEADERLR